WISGTRATLGHNLKSTTSSNGFSAYESESAMSEPIRFFLDGTEVEAAPGETIWQVAQRHGVEIPHLCWLPKPGYRADGNCRACMHCNLCVRACREVQVNDVIGMAGRGHGEKIVFDFDDPMGRSTCVACGECVQACPTGALMPASLVDQNGAYCNAPDRQVESVCPYCGLGCQLTHHIKDDHIVAVQGKAGPSNHNRLCVKGRFGFDYVHHPDRLTEP